MIDLASGSNNKNSVMKTGIIAFSLTKRMKAWEDKTEIGRQTLLRAN